MTDTRSRIPLGLPTAVGVAGLGAVIATGGHGWQLAVSAVLALALVAVDAYRALTRNRA